MTWRLWMPFVLVPCLVLAISRITASTGYAPQNHPEHLEVTGGTGSGDYLEGEVVSLSLTLQVGMTVDDFSHWEVISGDGELQNAEDPNATFVMGAGPAEVTAVFLAAGADPAPWSVFFGTDETTGPKYRKIGLNGFPIPDEKPQAAEETDEEPEETFIDAFHHTLTHQTTDVYIPMQGSELSLSIRRNWQPETWNDGSGLPPADRPDRPFGPGWRSNVCATIEFVRPVEGARPTATVTDENGVSYRFMAFGLMPQGNGTYAVRYVPLAENRHQQEVLATTLEHLGGDSFRFTRKMGSTLEFELTSEMRTAMKRTRKNRPPKPESFHQWARLVRLHDRFGNTMTYSYEQSPHQLFPTSISLRGKSLKLSYGASHLVERVADPRGNEKKYTYASAGPGGALNALSQVQLAPGITTGYTYSSDTQPDPTPQDPMDTGGFVSTYYYFDLGGIRDPGGKLTAFGYAFDRSRLAYIAFTGQSGAPVVGWFAPAGNPRNVTSVITPETRASFAISSTVKLSLENAINGQAQPEGSRVLRVVDAGGGSWTWTFSEGVATNMLDFVNIPNPGEFKAQLMIQYLRMDVSTPENGSMEATFEKSAGMALKSFRDVGALVATTFEYTDRFDFSSRQPWMMELGSLLALYPVQYWGDPTRQTDGNGKVKTFAYDARWRMMKRIADEEGRTTTYDIDPLNGNRKTETISGAGGTTTTEFRYDSRAFPGILTSKNVYGGTNGGHSSGNLFTVYTPDADGNISHEQVGRLPATVFQYDDNNNKTSSTDPRGNKTIFAYDAQNRLVTIDPPGPGNRTITYDARGNKVAERDENGHATLREFDGLGRVTAEARDMNGNGVIDAADLVTRTQYTGLGAKRLMTDPRGNTTRMQYDGLNRLRVTTDALGNTANLEYGANSGGLQFGKGFQPTRMTDARGFRTDITYDNAFREISRAVEYRPGIFTNLLTERDAVGNVIKETDGLGRVTTHTYDARNRRISTTFADNATVSTHYNASGLVWKTVDERGFDTLTDFDSAGRPIAVHSPPVDDGTGVLRRAVTQTTYDPAGNVLSTTNPLGRVWTFTYDERNRKLTEVRPGPGNPTLRWTYDNVGNVTKVTDARGFETDTTYNPANRPWKVEQPAVPVSGGGSVRPTTITEFDKNGNALQVTDPNRHVTTNAYDPLNRLLTTTDAAGIVVRNEYDAVGNRVAVVDGKNQRTEFEYDGLKRNTRITDALKKATSFEFDAVNKTARIDANGQRTDYLYDARHRLTTVNYAGRPQDNRTYSYDRGGNLLAVTEATPDRSVAYTYDALKRQESETSSGFTHTYRYDLAGNRVLCTYGGSGLTLVSTYDEQNRLASLSEGGKTTGYVYDPNGNLLTKTLPNGDKTISVYDAVNRTSSMTGTSGANAALYTYAYQYDASGNVKKVTENYPDSGQNRVVTNDYDDINRLVTETVTGSGALTTTFTYDEAHNRVGMSKGGIATAYSYNAANQLTKFTEGSRTVSFVYDDNGNRIKRTEGLATDDFTWDGENRLVAVSKATPGTPYAYQGSLTSNGQGAISVSSYSTYAGPALKVGQVVTISGAPLAQLNGAHTITSVWGSGSFSYQVPGTQSGGPVGVLVTVDQLNQQQSYQFGYDYRSRRVSLTTPTAPFTQVVFSGGTSVREIENGVAAVDYVRGSDWGGGVGGILYTLRAGVPSFTHYNRRGDVTAKTDGTGKITYQTKYEAFGKRTSETGATLDRQKSNTKDEDIPGYANEGFRFRDLETGTFISKDPAGFVDGPNVYAYVVQNPWTSFDPEGLKLDDLKLDGPAHFSASLDDSHNVIGLITPKLDSPSTLSAKADVIEQQSKVDLNQGTFDAEVSKVTQKQVSQPLGLPRPDDIIGGTSISSNKVAIDYDGDPHAYAPLGSGLVGNDFLSNAKSEGGEGPLSPNVIAHRNGNPVLNAEGFYVSMTSFHSGDPADQENNLNGQVFPYIALGKRQSSGAKYGDYICVTNELTSQSTWAIYGDSRGNNNIGIEMSPETARQVGVSFVKRGVTSQQKITIRIYPNSSQHKFPRVK